MRVCNVMYVCAFAFYTYLKQNYKKKRISINSLKFILAQYNTTVALRKLYEFLLLLFFNSIIKVFGKYILTSLERIFLLLKQDI